MPGNANRLSTVEWRVNTQINQWIVAAVLAGTHEVELLAGVCERLHDNGIAIMRASVGTDLLDPTFDGRGVRWTRGQEALDETYARSDGTGNETWLRSPFFALIESGEPTLRRRLDATYRRGEFLLLDEFLEQGVTDYLALVERVGTSVNMQEGLRGVVSSWTTDAPGGFSSAQITALEGIMPTLTMAFMLHTANRATRTLMTTYLGSDAAERVLAGNIVRGQAESIRAVVWFSDLVGFTRISETVRPELVLALLNDYAEAQVEEIEACGGHVLKFIGDGILAIFPNADTTHACKNALDAASRMRQRIAALNVRRREASLPVTDTHLALHVGELLYGNLGSPRRLDFTVLGPAVNEASRIMALCGSLEQTVIASSAFAQVAGDARSMLVSLGRYAMKGVVRPLELFTVDPG